MLLNRSLRLSALPLAGLLFSIGCQTDKTLEEAAKVDKVVQVQIRLFERSIYMYQVAEVAGLQLKGKKDKDPKVAARHRAFLHSVEDSALSYAKTLRYHDPLYIPVMTEDKDKQEADLRWVLLQAYEAAKLGVEDEALAKTWKDSLMADLRMVVEIHDRQREEKATREKAQKNW